jgi:DNA-binding response OmpR family regulator
MREAQLEAAWMRIGRFRLDPVTGMVVVNDGRVAYLTATEFQVLYDLLSHAGQFRASQDIFQAVWGGSNAKGNATNIVAVYVRRVRHKIEIDAGHPRYLLTSRFKGYRVQLWG